MHVDEKLLPTFGRDMSLMDDRNTFMTRSRLTEERRIFLREHRSVGLWRITESGFRLLPAAEDSCNEIES